MKTHRFTLTVESNGTRKQAETAVLLAFATRQPDGHSFTLHKSRPANPIKRKGKK